MTIKITLGKQTTKLAISIIEFGSFYFAFLVANVYSIMLLGKC